MSNFNEIKFKSIDNSKNINGLNWTIISLSITKTPIFFDTAAKFCLYRKIAYLDKEDRVYQIGKLYVPITNFASFVFFIRLCFSGKTFGHFITSRFSECFKFIVVESGEPINSCNILFGNNAKIKHSKRVVNVVDKKLTWNFYVEEELEVT